jgi:hypothetical protein
MIINFGVSLMSAPLGNDFAVGHGRPLDLHRELGRLQEARARVGKLLEQQALAGLLAAEPVELDQRLLDQGARIDALFNKLTALVAEVDELAPTKRQRRKRRKRLKNGVPTIHYDQYSREISMAVLLLDRLCPATEESN